MIVSLSMCVAHHMHRPQRRRGGAGPGVTTPGVTRAAASAALGARPDNRAGFLGARPSEAVDEPASNGGFHWDDAAIGVATAAGLMLLALAAARVLRRERRAH